MFPVKNSSIYCLHRPAVFFDRDGTLNLDCKYPHKIEDLFLIPGAAKAVRRFQKAGYYTVIITNQSGIARGYFNAADLLNFNAELVKLLAAKGAGIDLILHCPHHPDITGPCACRKPGKGLIKQACAKLPIDLSRSIVIGDRSTDTECAEAVGIPGYLFKGGDLDEFCRGISF